mgnify:CR=1 FL=1
MVVLGLWTARRHLWDVMRHVWRSEPRSDGDELISYRMAVIGVLSGVAVMCGWLWGSGLSPWAVCLFLLGAFVIFFALTRVIVEAGLAAAVQGMSGCGALVSSVGSTALGIKGLVALGMTLAWAGDLLVFMMAPCANGIRMLHGLGRYRRRILVMMTLAMGLQAADFTQEQASRIARVIGFSMKNHPRQIKLDDTVSALFLDNYL